MAKRRWKWWDTTRRDPTGYFDVTNVIPNMNGNYESAKQAVVFGSGNTVNGIVISSDAFQKTDGTVRLFACTATKIYEVTSSSATDRSAGGGSYTSASAWHGVQYGDVTIYTSRVDDVQASSSGAFADLAGTPPKAKYVATQSLAVALAAYNDGVNTYEDGVWFSDIGDHTTWTPSSSNQAANLRLLQTPGAVTALVGFKGDFIAFKDNSIYRLSYVGGDIIWSARLVCENIGAPSPGAVCVCGDVIVFGCEAGWFVFDGQNDPQEIAPPYQQRNFQVGGRGGPRAGLLIVNAASHYEPITGLAVFWAPTPVTYVVQVKPGLGYGAMGVYSVLNSSGSATVRCLIRGTSAALIAGGVGSASDGFTTSYFLGSGSDSLPYVLRAEWGAQYNQTASYVDTSFFGDPRAKTLFKRVTPVLGGSFASAYAGTCSMVFKERSDFTDTTSPVSFTLSSASVNPRFDGLQSARFAKFKISTLTAPMEIEEILLDTEPAGTN